MANHDTRYESSNYTTLAGTGSWSVLVASLLLLAGMGCGRVILPEDGGMVDPDGGTVDSLPPGDSGLVCSSPRLANWQGVLEKFEAETGTTLKLDFETRGDGITQVMAGQIVPADEYVPCCGVRIEPSNASAGGVIWAGNPVGGFSVRASCAGVCGVRFTFLKPVLAMGANFAGSTNASVLATPDDKTPLSMMSFSGSGTNFLGYLSDKPFEVAVYEDPAGEDLEDLQVEFCP